MIRDSVRQIAAAFTEWLYPPSCPSCLNPALQDLLCDACSSSLVRIPRSERVRQHSLAGIQTVALCRYEEPLRSVIHRLKYEGTTHAARALGVLSAKECRDQIASLRMDSLVPIPLHWRRRRARGYNQAELLARPMERILDLELRPGLLKRIKSTTSQVGQGVQERRRNLDSAFRAESCFGRAVLLIDDVVTTGSTIRAAAAALLEAGARRVAAHAICRIDHDA